MAKVEIADIHDNSLDDSADSELLGMVEEGSFGSVECDRPQIVSQSVLDSNEEDLAYSRYISGGVTYKFIPIGGGEESSSNNMSAHSPTHVLPSGEFYVISNPVEVYNTGASPKKVIKRQHIQSKAIATAKKRDDKRRATHNEVERRRRDKINSWITKLAALVPTSGLPDTASKGGILANACDYITELTDKQKRLEKLEEDNDKLVLEILRLNHELSEVRNENTAMRAKLLENGLAASLPSRPKSQKS